MNDALRALFVLEYSVEQDAFHISTLGDILASNLRKLASLKSADYMMLAITETYDEASQAAAKLRFRVDQLIASDRNRRAERIREDLGVSLDFNDLHDPSLWK
jgi:hypothetical protein